MRRVSPRGAIASGGSCSASAENVTNRPIATVRAQQVDQLDSAGEPVGRRERRHNSSGASVAAARGTAARLRAIPERPRR